MAAGGVSAFEVGSYFISTYYRVLKESPGAAHQFYSESSNLTLVDGDDTRTVNTIDGFYEVLTSLKVSGVEVTKLNCQDSINGGILLVVSGIMKSENFSGKRKFTQIFFLAPQVKGFFVSNDILQFNDELLVTQHPVPEIPEIKVESEIPASSPHLEQSVPDYELEEESREYVNSLHIEEDDPVDKYSLPDEEHHEEPHIETIVEETPVDEPAPLETPVNHINYVEESIPVPADEPVLEPPRVSYASILRAAKGQSAQQVSQPTVRKSMPPPPEQQQKVQAASPQLNPSASSYVPEAPNATGSDEALVQEEELTSVYVRSLPTNVTNADLEKELKKFGRIKPSGIVIKNKKDVGVCFAFVEYEDISGAHNAIKSSPIEVLGKQVYIEERRQGSNSSSRGGVGRGRGRGNYQSNTSRGRGGIRNSGRGILGNGNGYGY